MPDSPNTLIELRNISKVYGMGDVQVHALRDVSLTIAQGEYVAVIGASGSGKSTLMNIIGLLDRPTQGDYFLRGQEVARLSRRHYARIRNQEIGFVFQSFNLLPRVSARRQVELPLMYAGLAGMRSRQKALAMLEQVGLGDRAKHLPEELSGGQKQRVAIARALINRPSLLLADEPTGALDTQTSAEILQLFEQMRQEMAVTIMMVTHDMNVAQRTDRIITMRDGAIIADTWGSAIVHAPDEPRAPSEVAYG
ncbi:MAG: ABC transporter ATP-binding protein [Caldilineaceae bacterium]